LEHLEKVGQGRSGQVFRAWDPLLQREVALKLCRCGGISEETYALVLQEARLLARVPHPKIVTVYDLDHHDGWVGVSMEFIRGKTLEALLGEHGRLSAGEAALVGLDLCSALGAVHERGLLHRDIKAKNVMREEGGRIVLMDFGLSQDLRGETDAGDGTVEICGTLLYMAPELLRGGKASAQSDIFSLGILLYHLVTDSFPVEGRDFSDIRRAYEQGEGILLRDRRAALPEPFVRAIERALSPDPRNRFATAGHMAQALSASLAERLCAKRKARRAS
jgi:eukaryotic-like serine/threonine-protein kinase